MRFIGTLIKGLLLLAGLLLLTIAAAAPAHGQQISPHRDIRWPPNCNNGPGMMYNWLNNTCLDMNAIDPSHQLAWPANCAALGMVYNSQSNSCINMNAIDPSHQVVWPANCAAAGMVYNFQTNTCLNMNQIDPSHQVTWPPSCSGGVYVPATNICVPPGTAANPAGNPMDVQMNAGGAFGPASGVQYDNNGGLVGKQFGALRYASQWQTPPNTGNNGILNAFTGTGQTVFAEPSYASTETYGFANTKQLSMGPSQAQLFDYRNGNLTYTCHDPGPNIYNTYNHCWHMVMNSTLNQGPIYGHQYAAQFDSFNLGPGVNNGSAAVGPNSWTVGVGFQVNSTASTPGIHQAINAILVKPGIGDNDVLEMYSSFYGGAVAGSDEGHHFIGGVDGESNYTFTGNVLVGGAGATTVKASCLSDCSVSGWGPGGGGGPGDGRFLVDTSAVLDSGRINGRCTTPNGFNSGSCPIDHTITASTAIGNLSAHCNTGNAPLPLGTGYNTVTCPVNLTSGAFSTTGLMCFAGSFHEQAAAPSSIVGLGSVQTSNITSWSITANVVTFQVPNSFYVGQTIGLSGFATSTFFNYQLVTVTTANSSQFTAAWSHANQTSTTESGVATNSAFSNVTSWTINSSNGTTFQVANSFAVGQIIGLSGFTVGTFFNGQTVTVLTASSTQFTATFSHGSASGTEAAAIATSFVTMTMQLRHAHQSGTQVYQGGACGQYLNLTVNNQNAVQVLHYPRDVAGSDANHIFYNGWASASNAQALGGNFYAATFNATNLTNVGGVVYFTISPFNLSQDPEVIGETAQFSGTTGTINFNGPCTNIKWGAIGVNASPLYYCTQASSIGATPQNATLALGANLYGNTDYVTWAGAETLDVLDHTLNPPAVFNTSNQATLTLEPNNAAWANIATTANMTGGSPNITVASGTGITAGQIVTGNVPTNTTVLSVAGTSVTLSANALSTNASAAVTFIDATEQVHHYSAIYMPIRLAGNMSNPEARQYEALFYQFGGPAFCCGSAYSPPNGNAAAMVLDNTEALTNYVGHGGIRGFPGGLTLGWNAAGIGGQAHIFSYGVSMVNPPEPAGTPAFWVGCSAICTDPNYFYYIFSGANNQSANFGGLKFVPLQNEFSTAGNWVWTSDFGLQQFRDVIRFASVAAPTLSLVSNPSTGGNLQDGATYRYTVYAKNSVGGGVQSNELVVNTPSTGSNSSSVNLSWTRSAGTWGYVVCRTVANGATATESQIVSLVNTTQAGSDNTVWTDNGTNSLGSLCPNVDASLGYIDNAAKMTFASTGTTNKLTLQAPANMASSVTMTAIKVSVSITPAAATTGQCAEQVFNTFTGLAAGYAQVSPPGVVGAHVWIGWARASAANTLAIGFCADATGGTPIPGTYVAVQF